jgi:hypothetical protein
LPPAGQDPTVTEVDDDQGAFREGLFVRALGCPCNTSPYPLNSEEAVLWEMGWRLINVGREAVRPTNLALSRFRPILQSTPGVDWADSRYKHAGPEMVGASARGSLVDVTIILTFVAMLVGMWLATMR